MREGWSTYRLGDVSDFEGGSQPPKSNFVDKPRDGYIRLLQIRDFKSEKYAVYIPVAEKNRICKTEDIMIGRYGASVGQIHRGKAGAYNVALIKTTPNEKIINKHFFYYYLTSNLFQRPLMSVADRSAQAGFSKADIAPFQIFLPQLPEQKQIVTILDGAFSGIDQAIANTEKNLASACELFESYLNTIFTQSNQSEERALNEISSIFAGGDVNKDRLSATKTEEYSVPIFTNGEKNKGLYGYTDLARVFEPSLTVSARGTIGYCEIRNEPFYPAVRLIVITPDTELVELDYLRYSIKRLTINHSGVSIPQLTIPMIRDYKIPVPPLAEQKIMAKKLDRLYCELKNLEDISGQKLAALNELKQSLLHKAFSGELTADVADEIQAEAAE